LPHTAALGVTRRVPDNTPMVTFEHCQYSLPATLLGHTVWIRHHDGTGEVVICALDDGGPVEVARHRRATPGSPAIDDSHFPEHRMTATAAMPAQLPADVESLMRALRLPHARAIAAEVLATARPRRWDPTEAIKALLTEESAGRARSMLAARRQAAGFPTGKTFDVWDPGASSIPLPSQ